MICEKCGNTGLDLMGNPCPAGCYSGVRVKGPQGGRPKAYYGLKFNPSLVEYRNQEYITKLSNIMDHWKNYSGEYYGKNLLIAAPPKSSKHVFIYTLMDILRFQGLKTTDLMDFTDITSSMFALARNQTKENLKTLESLTDVDVVFIYLPKRLPDKWADSINDIIKFIVNKSSNAIFIYDGREEDLDNQDTFKTFDKVKGDGTLSTLLLIK